MFPVGAEVGFSSAGAGALGSAALLSLTPLAAGAGGGHRYRLRICGVADRQRRALVLADRPIRRSCCNSSPEASSGAIGGTLLSTHIPRRPLRFALWIWLLVLGGQFLFNSYKLWTLPHKDAAHH